MTEVELVAAALAAGASAGLTDTARGAVQDLYTGLREAVRRRLDRAVSRARACWTLPTGTRRCGGGDWSAC